jgi:hypothetical protein
MKAKLSDAELAKELESLNEKRIFFTTITFIFIFMVLLSCVISIILVFASLYFTMPSWYLKASLYLLVGGGIIGIPFAYIPAKYGKKMKLLLLDMIEDTLKNNFELIKYNHDSHIPETMVRETKFYNFRRIHGNDFIHAKYKGVGFMFSDLWFDSNHNNKASNPFSSQWLVITMVKEINPTVTITGLPEISFIGDSRKKVQMENMAFNKQFRVFTENFQMAFYVLTPHFMEFIMSLNQFTDGKIHLCFTGFYAYVAIFTDNSSFYPNHDEYMLNTLRKKMQREVDFIKRVIDELLQNERLFGPAPGDKKI